MVPSLEGDMIKYYLSDVITYLRVTFRHVNLPEGYHFYRVAFEINLTYSIKCKMLTYELKGILKIRNEFVVMIIVNWNT